MVSPNIDGIFLIQLVILTTATPLTYHQVLPFAELWTAVALSSYAEPGSLSESKVVISCYIQALCCPVWTKSHRRRAAP